MVWDEPELYPTCNKNKEGLEGSNLQVSKNTSVKARAKVTSYMRPKTAGNLVSEEGAKKAKTYSVRFVGLSVVPWALF